MGPGTEPRRYAGRSFVGLDVTTAGHLGVGPQPHARSLVLPAELWQKQSRSRPVPLPPCVGPWPVPRLPQKLQSVPCRRGLAALPLGARLQRRGEQGAGREARRAGRAARRSTAPLCAQLCLGKQHGPWTSPGAWGRGVRGRGCRLSRSVPEACAQAGLGWAGLRGWVGVRASRPGRAHGAGGRGRVGVRQGPGHGGVCLSFLPCVSQRTFPGSPPWHLGSHGCDGECRVPLRPRGHPGTAGLLPPPRTPLRRAP